MKQFFWLDPRLAPFMAQAGGHPQDPTGLTALTENVTPGLQRLQAGQDADLKKRQAEAAKASGMQKSKMDPGY